MPKRGTRKERQPQGDPDDPRGFERTTREFLEWMLVKNFSERTVGNRRTYLDYFVAWCLDRGVT